MLKPLKVLLATSLLTIGANATDFLSKATDGALGDNSIIKELRQATKDRLELDINNLNR